MPPDPSESESLDDWKPDELVEAVLRKQAEPLRLEWTYWYRNERGIIANRMAADGTLNSGGFVTAVQRAAESAIERGGRLINQATLETVDAVYGKVPPEAGPWLRRFCGLWLSSLANDVGEDAVGLVQSRAAGSPDACRDSIHATRAKIERELDIALSKIELRAKLKTLTPPQRSPEFAADVFISHASEDKADVAEPIARELERRGYTVWLDRSALRLGDRLLDKIDEGLAGCRYGVTILSEAFFSKNWPRRELAGLAARQDAEDRKIILPVWHGINAAQITRHSPILAAVLGVSTREGITTVVDQIEAVLKND